eukprot:GHVS01056681.1.p3 GENE.GHVS01056681.1~~GHVS01056681.1.p3  ORF type:complete len:157 (+),score=14.11 GHVS01056681.1:1111-1581(+)
MSIMSPAMARSVEVRTSEISIDLKGIGCTKSPLSELVEVQLEGVTIVTSFAIVPDFPYDLCIGLYDLFQVPAYREVLQRMFKMCNFKNRRLVVPSAPVNLASGVEEARKDDELLADGKKKLRETFNENMGEKTFNTVWSIFEKYKKCWLRPRDRIN